MIGLMTARHAIATTRLGELTLTADGDALTGLYFDAHWHPPTAARLGQRVDVGEPLFVQALEELDQYLDQQRTDFDVPIMLQGNAFQHQVWELIQRIPYGQTRSYGDLARELGNVNLSQRVGQCTGQNPISIVVPCHRVVGSDGSLTGYAGGLDRKRFLLGLEAPAQQESLF